MLITENNDDGFSYEKMSPLKSRTYITNVVRTLSAAFSKERHVSVVVRSMESGQETPHLNLGSVTYSRMALDEIFKFYVLQLQ